MKTRISAAMGAFDRMYEPHEARGQQFHTDEFTAMVNRVAGIEQELGIYDLNQFTPVITQYLPPAT
jgi:hypothetical protein